MALVDTYLANPTRDTDARWYHDARELAADRAAAALVPLDTYLAVVAAVSPQTQWDTRNGYPNLDAADRAISAHRFGTPPRMLGASWQRARRILDGEDPADVLGTRKIRNFYENLRAPGATDRVTIDRWAARAAGVKIPNTQKQYDTAADAYRAAASDLSIPPDALQAAVWAHVRRQGLQ